MHRLTAMKPASNPSMRSSFKQYEVPIMSARADRQIGRTGTVLQRMESPASDAPDSQKCFG